MQEKNLNNEVTRENNGEGEMQKHFRKCKKERQGGNIKEKMCERKCGN